MRNKHIGLDICPAWLRALLVVPLASVLLSGCGEDDQGAEDQLSVTPAESEALGADDDPWVIAGVETFTEEPAAKPSMQNASMLEAAKFMNGDNYLSDLEWISARTDYGPVERDQSIGSPRANDGNRPLIINGMSYSKGLGVHGESEVAFALSAQCTRFRAIVGINDFKDRLALGGRGSMVFSIVSDGVVVHETGVIFGNTPAQTIDISVSGVNELKLVTKNNGVPGNSRDSNYDHGDWADAKVTCVGSANPTPSPTPTPTPAPTPTPTPTVPAPTIVAFSAMPVVITAGESTTLTWTTANATTISINNGIGTVTGNTRIATPTQTMTYTLTASNATGSATRNTTVTVNPVTPPPSGVASRAIPNNTTPTSWSFCSNLYHGAGCEFDGMRQVRIGTGNKWVTKKVLHRLYGFECSHAFFGGDPAPGQPQRCEVANIREEGTITAPNSCYTEAAGCATIDLTKIPIGSDGYSDVRIRADSTQLDQVTDGGSFRTACEYSHMAFDDPIVYPGQPGRSHLHTFFGNTGTDAFSTAQSIANSGNSTCSGGIANRTAYWIPALIDTRNGAPVVPDNAIWYYKTFAIPAYPLSRTQALPSGLRMIAGDMHAKGRQSMAGWNCFNTGGNFSTIPTTCSVGDYVEMYVAFPSCWDGKNLDSPDHKSHMSYSRGAEGCPSTHPVPVPEIRLNVRYLVQNAEDPKHWRLSSDHSPNPPGLSVHADWFDGWIPTVRDTWVTNCSQRAQNCEVDILGDGTRLY